MLSPEREKVNERERERECFVVEFTGQTSYDYQRHWRYCSFGKQVDWLISQLNSVNDRSPLEKNLHYTAWTEYYHYHYHCEIMSAFN